MSSARTSSQSRQVNSRSDRGARQRKYPKELCATDEIDSHLNTTRQPHVWVHLKGERRSQSASDWQPERTSGASLFATKLRYIPPFICMWSRERAFWIEPTYLRSDPPEIMRLDLHSFSQTKQIRNTRDSLASSWEKHEMQLELFKRSVKYSRVSSGIHSIAEASQNFDDNISSSGETFILYDMSLFLFIQNRQANYPWDTQRIIINHEPVRRVLSTHSCWL